MKNQILIKTLTIHDFKNYSIMFTFIKVIETYFQIDKQILLKFV